MQNALPFLAPHVANLQTGLARFLAGMLEVDKNAVTDLQDLHVIALLLLLRSTQLSAHRLQLHDDLFVAAVDDEIRVALTDVVVFVLEFYLSSSKTIAEYEMYEFRRKMLPFSVSSVEETVQLLPSV